MALKYFALVTAVAVGSVIAQGSPFDTGNFLTKDIITRDVVVVGGGASGTYGAIKLKDAGKTVVVIEKQDRMGGHTNTYQDPAKNISFDYGVEVYHNISTTTEFFARFKIPLKISNLPVTNDEYVDFETGEIVNFTPPDFTTALFSYAALLAQYPYLENGFDLPNPVPADLLLPFSEFMAKYNLQSLSWFLFNFAQGLGNVFDQLTLYIFKNFGSGVIQGIISGFLVTANNDNSELYEAAQAELGSNVLLESHIVAMTRVDPHHLRIVVSTPTGLKLILANQILFTIPPLLRNLIGVDLTPTEQSLFSKFNHSAYYTGLIVNTTIPANLTLFNTRANTTFNIPPLPATYYFQSTPFPGLINVKLGAASSISNEQVKADILGSIKTMQSTGVLAQSSFEPAFVAYASHTPFELVVNETDVAAGFYERLYDLQGVKGTWWSGAAWHTHDSSLLWEFTDGVVQRMLNATQT